MENYKVYLREIEGHYYIGITKFSLEERAGKDGSGYYRNPHFKHVIDRYGWDSCKSTILYDNLTKEQACNLEIKLIAEYRQKYGKKCINVANGGLGGNLGDEVNEKLKENWYECHKNCYDIRNTKWYSNGIEERRLEEGKQPEGWTKGRLRKWYNNGIEEMQFEEGKQPEGWVIGGLKCRLKGITYYNNGIEVKVFEEGKQPDGWVKGKLKGRKWYNNGIEEKGFYEGTQPEGFTRGRLNYKRNKNKNEKPI